jgi:signal transduction histidine kinase
MSRFAAEAEALTDRRWRLLLGGAGVFYPLWAFHAATIPGAYDPLWMRLVVAAGCFGLLGARRAGWIGVRRLTVLAAAWAWLITAHYFLILGRNALHPELAAASLVVVYGGATCFISIRALASYSVYALALAAVTCLSTPVPETRPAFLLVALGTMLAFAFIAADGKLKILASLRDRRFELEERQRQLVQAARMSAVGTLAQGIAHEINNPLSVIGLKAERLADLAEMAPAETRGELLEISDKIVATVMRIARIIGILRTIGHPNEEEPVSDVTLVSLADSALGLYRERAREAGIELSVRDESRGASVPCRQGQIAQVLVHLLENAVESIARSDAKGRRWIRVDLAANDRFGEIAVVDSGPGVPPEHRDHLFDAFFTTKPVGQGMGVGLSYAARIAAAHGGDLRLDTGALHTRFALRLPDPRQPEAERAA